MGWTFDQIDAADPDFAGKVNANQTDFNAAMDRNHKAFLDEMAAADAQVAAMDRNHKAFLDPRDPKDPLIAAEVVTYRGTLPPIEVPTGVKNTITGLAVFGVVWVCLGLAGLGMSLFCLTRKGGTTSENILGILLAMCFGPFYWLYRLGSSTYCTKLKVAPLPQ